MEKLSHKLEVWAALLIHFIARSIGDREAHRFGRLIGRMMNLLMSSRSRVAHENLKNALGENLSDSEIKSITRGVYESFAQLFIEVARFGPKLKKELPNLITGETAKYLEESHNRGKGTILVTAHFGFWEGVGALPAALGYKTQILVLSQKNREFDSLLNRSRNKMGVGTLPTAEGLRKTFKALQNNEVIGLAADQHDSTQNLIIDFFGRPAAAAQGPAVFALRTGATLLPMLLVRKDYNRFEMIHDDPILPDEYSDTKENVKMIVERYHRFFERVIREYPEQWLWTHKRWKIQ